MVHREDLHGSSRLSVENISKSRIVYDRLGLVALRLDNDERGRPWSVAWSGGRSCKGYYGVG